MYVDVKNYVIALKCILLQNYVFKLGRNICITSLSDTNNSCPKLTL